jgi:hypothetical protein
MNGFGSRNGGVGLYVLLGIGVVAVFLAFMLMGWSNAERAQRNLLTAKQKDNTSEFDNLKKKINGIVSIPEAKMDALKSIFVEHAQARTSGGSQDGSLMKWVTESVPNVGDAAGIYDQVLNLVVASRDSWTQRQKEILDMKRVHDNILDLGFRGLFLTSVLGRQKIEVVIVTSVATKRAFETGEDNDDGTLFKRRADKPSEKTAVEK